MQGYHSHKPVSVGVPYPESSILRTGEDDRQFWMKGDGGDVVAKAGLTADEYTVAGDVLLDAGEATAKGSVGGSVVIAAGVGSSQDAEDGGIRR